MYETRTYSEVSSSSEGKTITSVRFISGKVFLLLIEEMEKNYVHASR